MNTIENNTVTSELVKPEYAQRLFLTDIETAKRVRKLWKSYVHSLKNTENKGPTMVETFIYCLLSGKSLRKAFTPIKNKTKLENGYTPYSTMLLALKDFRVTRRPLNTLKIYSALGFENFENPKDMGTKWNFFHFKEQHELTVFAANALLYISDNKEKTLDLLEEFITKSIKEKSIKEEPEL